MRVVIDPELCQGHARCVQVAPALFDLDEEGHGVVLSDEELDAADVAIARSAVINCPERAIAIV